jgi:DNA-binding transcriptional regulator YhcF (GntR family)
MFYNIRRMTLNPGSPVPLYHQIAESLRYRIAVGAIPAGAALPPVRGAAGQWGVNLHTVRRAYAELEEHGLVVTRPPKGTFVRQVGSGQVRGRPRHRLAAFLERITRDAGRRYGLTPAELADLLTDPGAAMQAHARVFVVECSLTQCADLARQLTRSYDVEAEPWPLDRPDEPPPGVVVATLFHYNDVRRRWPHRLAEVDFVAIRPDPHLARRVRQRWGRSAPQILVCEREEPMAQAIAADRSVVFPPARHRLIPRVTNRPSELLRLDDGPPVLFSPRVWGRLDEASLAHPRAFEARYVLVAADLESLARRRRWSPRAAMQGVGELT